MRAIGVWRRMSARTVLILLVLAVAMVVVSVQILSLVSTGPGVRPGTASGSP